jgi:quinol monooxygenase YgiN
MFALIATVRIDPANADTLEREFGEMAAYVRRNEPDTLAYYLARSREEAGCYKVIEVYRSEAAFRAHKDSAAFRTYRPKLEPLLLEPPVAERLDVAV